MLLRCLALMLTAVSCLAIPKSSAWRELQRLVRLPRLEFTRPVEFDRRFGFVAFPDPNTAALDVRKLLKGAKGLPDEAPLYLQAARIYDAQGDTGDALRQYSRATDLFRRRLEIAPREIKSIAGLGEALSALGRFAEAQSVLEGTEELGEPTSELLVARARYYRERAWFSAAGEVQRYSSGSFLNQLISMVAEMPPPDRIDEAKRYLDLAGRALDEAFEMDGDKEEKLLERAAFRSFRAALEAAFTQIQNNDLRVRAIELGLYNPDALKDLADAAALGSDPAVIAASALAAHLAAERTLGSGRSAEEYVRGMANRLRDIAHSTGENAAEAVEYLGCIQYHLFKDTSGARRTLQQALSLQSSRYRSWELMTIAAAYEGPEEFVETARARVEAMPTPRSSVLLVKSYDMQGDHLRAEWAALNAIASYPNDLMVNLCLAAVLLKDENAESFLWRASEALNKAEKALGSSRSQQNHVDFLLLKSIYLALSDQPEQARTLITGSRFSSPELQEVLRALD